MTVCGEIGGKPLEAMALIGLGFRQPSMSATAIGPVKAMVLQLDATRVADLVHEAMEQTNGPPLRPALAKFAEAHGIPA